ncbi:MAG: hypothetical protein H6711_07050 [Myxococcales bacterium]|nr:hypothetical protein [Myxococcales bacterium]
MTTSPRRRAWIFGLFALWLLEWVFAFSAALGRPGELLGLLWWIALAYFVIESRTGRMPRWLHTWLWLGAVLGIAVLRAWVIGDEGLLIFHAFAEMAGEPERLGALVASGEWIAADALVTSMLLGMLIGIAGLCESLVIMGMSWVGDLLGSRREAARVGIVPRMVVWALQAPIFGGLMGCSLAIIAGAVGALVHPGTSEVGDTAGLALGVGLGGWALAVLLFGRLGALARGGLVTRVILGIYAVFGVVVLLALTLPGLGALLLGIAWLIAQVAALRWARPRAA